MRRLNYCGKASLSRCRRKLFTDSPLTRSTPIAVAKIFEAKERPRFDPLIVHLPNREWLGRIADVPAGDRQLIAKLADKFWPGPFTMVLAKREIVPDIVTAGLETVAVRFSAHPVFAEIVGELDEPLAAPSANRFGRVSPTTAQHVLDELDGRIPLIVDAGPTEHGIESTIVAIRDAESRSCDAVRLHTNSYRSSQTSAAW